MRTIQLYATGAATATGVANVTIPISSRIKGIQVALTLDSSADNTQVACEFSKTNASTIGTNSAQDPFLEVRAYNNLAANGQVLWATNGFFPLDIDCVAGQQIFVHAFVSGTGTYFVNAIIHYA